MGDDLLYQLGHLPKVAGMMDLKGLERREWLRDTLRDTIMGGCISLTGPHVI